MKTLNKQILLSFMAIGGVVTAYVTVQNSGTSINNVTALTKDVKYPVVSTITPNTTNSFAQITGYGVVAPVQHLSLSASINGRVSKISPKLKSGGRFIEGEVLLEIDDTDYREAVATGESALATAELELLQQELNRKQAQAEWLRSGLSGQPESKLALYEPQVKAAQAKVKLAKQSLAKANANLNKTRVRAPFSALVVSKNVEVGSYVQASTELAVIHGVDQAEVSIPLSSKEWGNLPENAVVGKQWLVPLFDTESDKNWIGYVDRVELNIDNSTRQRSLIVRIENPLQSKQPLYSGTFVKAEVQGKLLENTWQIPASSITKDNKFWYVDNLSTLQYSDAVIQFSFGDNVWIEPKASITSPKILSKPLISYLPGLKVQAVSALSEVRNTANVSYSQKGAK